MFLIVNSIDIQVWRQVEQGRLTFQSHLLQSVQDVVGARV